MRHEEDIISFFFNRAREDISEDEWERHRLKLRGALMGWNNGTVDPEQVIPVAWKRKDGRKQRLSGALPACFTADITTTLWWYKVPQGDAALILEEIREEKIGNLKRTTSFFRLWRHDSDSHSWERLPAFEVKRFTSSGDKLVQQKFNILERLNEEDGS